MIQGAERQHARHGAHAAVAAAHHHRVDLAALGERIAGRFCQLRTG